MRELIVDSFADHTALRKPLLVADLMCGAGGSTEGCEQAVEELGLDMEIVVLNHWATAINTHSANHPKARHICQDIATVRPHILVPEGYLDLLMASPTCTHHSIARGGKPTSDQQRSDPWHIITWLTELRVKRMIIENVWEYVKWGPVDPRTGRPIKEREGEYFNAWIDTIRRLGAKRLEWRKLNSANYGGATTRQRFFGFFRFDDKPLLWPVATHGKLPVTDASLKPWKAARHIIDWSIKGRSIFNRPVPLAPKTIARILAGARKFGWPEILILMLLAEQARSLAHAIRYSFARRHAKRSDLRRRHRVRVVQYAAWLRQLRAGASDISPEIAGEYGPMVITLRNHADGRSIGLPIPAVAANGRHIGLAQPIVVNMKGRSTANSIDGPLPTQTSHAAHVYLAEPFVLAPGSTGAPRTTGEPLPTITTGGAGAEDPGCARPMLIEPFLLSRHGEGHGETRAHSLNNPAPTASCSGGGYLVEPFLLSRHGDGAPRSTEEPTPTQVAKHSHILITPYYGSGSGETCQTVEQPLPTATGKPRFGIVIPITHSDNSNRARDVEVDPLLTTAHRGELAFITAQFGEREGQVPRVHSIDNPAPAICATGHVNLVEATGHDVLFRMLETHELAGAMGFNSGRRPYKFTGTKTEQVKQIGNAVSVEQMKANCRAMLLDEIEPASQFMEVAE